MSRRSKRSSASARPGGGGAANTPTQPTFAQEPTPSPAQLAIQTAHAHFQQVIGTRDALLAVHRSIQETVLFHSDPDAGHPIDEDAGALIDALDDDMERIRERVRAVQPHVALAAEAVVNALDIEGLSRPQDRPLSRPPAPTPPEPGDDDDDS